MNRILFVLPAATMAAFVLLSPRSAAQTPAPRQEVRGVWITTVNGLDWPQSTDPAEQRRSLKEMIGRIADARLNTIYFQIRDRGDALYRSRFEPWSNVLTGTLGRDPGWDPLQFVIDEAHARGMEVHAWFNTFLVRSGKAEIPQTSPRHLVLAHPDWLRPVDGDTWMDPGLPAVREYLVNVVRDIAVSYDVDGIQFDFIRYPAGQFPDDQTYRKYGGAVSREDWRRENINQFVRACYKAVTALKPYLKIGSAPIGVYLNTPAIRGLQGYAELFQDSREWLREGVHDYVCPQVYWSLGTQPADPDFAAVTEDWARNASGRQVVVGIGAYKPEVHRQLPGLIDAARRIGVQGVSFFRYRNIEDSFDMGLRFANPAIIPPMKWKDSIPPEPPVNLAADPLGDGTIRLSWQAPAPASDGGVAARYVVYRASGSVRAMSDPSAIAAVLPASATSWIDRQRRQGGASLSYAVSALDRLNNESRTSAPRILFSPEFVRLASPYESRTRLGGSYRSADGSVAYLHYDIGARAPVIMKILDSQNREVLGVVDAMRDPGTYIAAADVRRLPNGAYTCLFVAGSYSVRQGLSVSH